MKYILLLFLAINVMTLNAQTDFEPGYYIIKEGGYYSVIQPGGNDYVYDPEAECYNPSDFLFMRVNEVVIAYAKFKDKVFCFDPQGRMLVFSSMTALVKAPTTGGVVKISETTEMMSGPSIMEGSYMWVSGQNVAQETVKVFMGDGTTVEIPQRKVVFFDKILNQYVTESVDYMEVMNE